MTKLLRLFTVAVWLAILAVAGAAQDAPTPVKPAFLDQINGLSADEAVRKAIAGNDEINAIRKEAEAAEQRIAQANQRARLSLEASGQQRTFGSAHRYTIQGTMPLELGGRRRTRVLTARREADVKVLAVVQAESALAARVRNKFGESLALVLKHKLTEDLLRSLGESYRLIQARVAEGRTAPLEENMLLVELNRVKAMREISEANVRIALLELKTMLGIEPAEALLLKGELDHTPTGFEPLSVLTAAGARHTSGLKTPEGDGRSRRREDQDGEQRRQARCNGDARLSAFENDRNGSI